MAAKKKGNKSWNNPSGKKLTPPEEKYPFEYVEKDVTLSDGQVVKAKVKVFKTLDPEPGPNPVGIKNWYY